MATTINTPRSLPDNFPFRCRLEVDAFSWASFLNDRGYLTSVVEKLAGVAKMQLIKVVATEVAVDPQRLGGDRFVDDGGVSVQGLITTSHIALHAWPQRHFFMFDLVSCTKFAHLELMGVLRDLLQIERIAYQSFANVADLHREHHGITQ